MTDSAHALNGRGGAALSARVRAIELEQVEQGAQQRSHERGCDLRQEAIIKAFGEVNSTLSDLVTKVGDLTLSAAVAKGVAEGAARARKPKWWMDPVLAAVLSAMLMGTGGLVNHLLEGSRPLPSPVTISTKVN